MIPQRRFRALKWFGLVGAAVLALCVVAPISAQAALINCSPPVSANLPEPPQVLVCRFASPVDGAQSSFQVFNAQGERVDENDTRNFSRDPELVAVTLNQSKMPTGVYAVRWMVTAEAGGTVWTGEFQIGIRTPVTNAPTSAPPADARDSSVQASTNDIVRQLIVLVLGGLALVGIGGVLFWLWQGRRKRV